MGVPRFASEFSALVAVLLLLLLWKCRPSCLRARRRRACRTVRANSELTEMVRLHRSLEHHVSVTDSAASISSDSFHSCKAEESDQSMLGAAHCAVRRAPLPKRPRQNKNAVADYGWLYGLLETIAAGRASSVAATDCQTGQRCVPLFVVAGTSPSKFPPSPMQAVMYCGRPDGSVDFWFVKPDTGRRTISAETLHRHASGKLRNVALRSSDFFAPLAKLFRGETHCGHYYGVDAGGRAYVEERVKDGRWRRVFVYFIWIESWRGGRRPFLEGKICFQRQEAVSESKTPPQSVRDLGLFFSRQYRIQDGVIHLAAASEEEMLPALMPSTVGFQEMV